MPIGRRLNGAASAHYFALGKTKPTANNTGLRVAGTNVANMSTVSSNITHATDGATYQNTRFTGYVNVTGKNITYRNCWFNAPAATAASALVRCLNANVQNATFENCLFKPSTYELDPSIALGNCIMGHDYTLYRCDLSGGIDLVGVYSGVNLSTPAANVNILGCYMHDMVYYSPDPSHADNQSHCDGVQVHGGAVDFLMQGTSLSAMIDPNYGQASDPPVDDGNGNHLSGNKQYPWLVGMSAFMLSPVNTTAGVANFVIDQNWLGGGIVVINWPRSDGTGIAITNNRWTRGTYLGDDFTVLMQAGQAATITGNYYEDTLTAYNGRKNG